MRWLNPSAVLNFRKPSMALAKESETLDFDVPGELRFIRNSSIFGKMSTAVRQANEKPEPDGLWFDFRSGEWIRIPSPQWGPMTSFFFPKQKPPFQVVASSGEWIRNTDLRVMRDFPGFGTFFTQAPHFSLA